MPINVNMPDEALYTGIYLLQDATTGHEGASVKREDYNENDMLHVFSAIS